MSDDFILRDDSACAEQYMHMVGHSANFDRFYTLDVGKSPADGCI